MSNISGRKVAVVAVLLFPLGLVASSMVDSGEIEWSSDLDTAFAAARDRGALVMVEVYTDWCGWCRKLEREVFTDDAVVGLSRDFVNLKVNAEDGGRGQALAARYGVRGYPTVLFLNPDGTEVARISGFLPPQDFFNELKKIKKQNGE